MRTLSGQVGLDVLCVRLVCIVDAVVVRPVLHFFGPCYHIQGSFARTFGDAYDSSGLGFFLCLYDVEYYGLRVGGLLISCIWCIAPVLIHIEFIY